MPAITNENLSLTDIPNQIAEWGEISTFALTFDGYKRFDSFHECAEIANSRRHDSLTNIRTCLFFEQRRWRHFGEEPDNEAMTYIRDLVEKIRSKVSAKDLQ